MNSHCLCCEVRPRTPVWASELWSTYLSLLPTITHFISCCFCNSGPLDLLTPPYYLESLCPPTNLPYLTPLLRKVLKQPVGWVAGRGEAGACAGAQIHRALLLLRVSAFQFPFYQTLYWWSRRCSREQRMRCPARPALTSAPLWWPDSSNGL